MGPRNPKSGPEIGHYNTPSKIVDLDTNMFIYFTAIGMT